VLLDAFGSEVIDLDAALTGTAAVAGTALFRAWVLPFELLSVLLLAALVGAVVLSRGEIGRDSELPRRAPGEDD
jgi:NADH-quinone oxidoreductase subunit J